MDINLPISPPINNNIQTSLNDKLDAITFEKIRVVNTLLDTRLSLQEKTLNKHRKDVERTHALQTQRLRREVKKIRQKKPDYVFDDSDISTSKSRITDTSRPRSLSDSNNLCYCRRYYSHHFNVKDTTKVDKKIPNGKKDDCNDFFNLKLRLYYVNMMSKAVEYTSKLNHDEGQGYDPFLGRDLKDDELSESYGTGRTGRFFTQSSGDYESDDVFENSHSNFKASCGLYSNKLEHINDSEEINPNVNEDNAESIKESIENDADLPEKSTKRGINNVEIRRHSEFPRDGRRKPSRRVTRRNTDGAGLHLGHESIEANRRKSKHAFEKIFDGLL